MSYDLHHKRQINTMEENHQLQQENDETEGKSIVPHSYMKTLLSVPMHVKQSV